MSDHARRHSAVSCAKMAEPIVCDSRAQVITRGDETAWQHVDDVVVDLGRRRFKTPCTVREDSDCH